MGNERGVSTLSEEDVRRIEEWFDSGEAAIAFQKASEETDRAIARMNEARRVTRQQMNTPIGPFSRNC